MNRQTLYIADRLTEIATAAAFAAVALACIAIAMTAGSVPAASHIEQELGQ